MTNAREATKAYWVVIPAYNEAETVRDVAMRARQQCAHVIVVDDASSDGTAGMLAGLDVTVLRNEENRGKAGSLGRGFQHALSQGAIGIITLDADGQHAPEEIRLFLSAATNDRTAFLIGRRCREQRKASVARYVANRIADFWIGWDAGRPIEDSQSGFRLYPASLVRAGPLEYDRARSFVFESEIVIEASRQGFAIQNVSITVTPRLGLRPSHFRPLLDIARITKMVAGKILSRGLYLNGLHRSLSSSTKPRGGDTMKPGRGFSKVSAEK